MKITDIRYKVITATRKVKFVIALTSGAADAESMTEDCLFVRVDTDEGISGYGEASPFKPVTGNSIPDIVQFLKDVKPLLVGLDPICIERLHAVLGRAVIGKTSGKAALDMALYDIAGKAANLPLYKLLGGDSDTVNSDITIGIDSPDTMAEYARQYTSQGFGILKVKTGVDPVKDLEAVGKIRAAAGPAVSIRLDANQGWSKKQAVATMRKMEEFDVDEIEQPLPWWDLEGLHHVREHITQDLMLDETVHSPQDAARAIAAGAGDIVNIKLMKSGGIYPALQINAVAQASGLPCMVGCMDESRVAIAAGAALAAAKRNISYADLDSHNLLEEIPGVSGGFIQIGGRITLLDKPGLGLDIEMEF